MVVLAGLVLLACNKGDEDEVRYNDNGDLVKIYVGEGDVSPRSTTLLSSVGRTEVGTATVDPGAGPVGTRHTALVDLSSDYEEDVDRVSVTIDAGERGVVEFDLEHDLADVGLWALDLESLGAQGETRVDIWRFRLWQSTRASSGGGDPEDTVVPP